MSSVLDCASPLLMFSKPLLTNVLNSVLNNGLTNVLSDMRVPPRSIA